MIFEAASPDGEVERVAWDPVDTDDTGEGPEFGGVSVFKGVSAFDLATYDQENRFLAWGTGGALKQWNGGTPGDWEDVDSTVSSALNDAAFHNGRKVVVGNGRTLLVQHPEAVTGACSRAADTLGPTCHTWPTGAGVASTNLRSRGVARLGHNQFVVVGEDAIAPVGLPSYLIYVSGEDDLDTWTRVEVDAGSMPDCTGTGITNPTLRDVARVGPLVVAVGDCGWMLVSRDGVEWSRVVPTYPNGKPILYRAVADNAVTYVNSDPGENQIDMSLSSLIVGENGTMIYLRLLDEDGLSLGGVSLPSGQFETTGFYPTTPPWGAGNDALAVWSDERTRVVAGEGFVFAQPKEDDPSEPDLWMDITPPAAPTGSVWTSVASDAVRYVVVGHNGSGDAIAWTGTQDVETCVSLANAVDTDERRLWRANVFDDCVDDGGAVSDLEDPTLTVGPAHNVAVFDPDVEVLRDTGIIPSASPTVVEIDVDPTGDTAELPPALRFPLLWRVNIEDRRGADIRHLRVHVSRDLPGTGDTGSGEIWENIQANRVAPKLPPAALKYPIVAGSVEYALGTDRTFVDVLTGIGLRGAADDTDADTAPQQVRGWYVDYADTEDDLYMSWPIASVETDYDTGEVPSFVLSETDTDAEFETGLETPYPGGARAFVRKISRLRSGAGHDFSDDYEGFAEGYDLRLQSMKHYFQGRCGQQDCLDTDPGACDDIEAMCCDATASVPAGWPRVGADNRMALFAPIDGRLYDITFPGPAAFVYQQAYPDADPCVVDPGQLDPAYAEWDVIDTADTSWSPGDTDPPPLLPNPYGEPARDRDLLLIGEDDNIAFVFFHVDPTRGLDHDNIYTGLNLDGASAGQAALQVGAGQRIAMHRPHRTFDIAVYVNDQDDRWRLVSYFDVMPEPLYNGVYRKRFGFGARGGTENWDPVIELSQRDECPLRFDTGSDFGDTRTIDGPALHPDGEICNFEGTYDPGLPEAPHNWLHLHKQQLGGAPFLQ